MVESIFLIGGMALATYVSRVTPFYLLPKEGIPKRLESFLFYVPPAAIGALIFPDVLLGPAEAGNASLLAAIVAGVMATRSRALWLTVGAAILAAFLAISVGAV